MPVKLKPFTLTKKDYYKLLTALQKRKLKFFLRAIYSLIIAILVFSVWGFFNGFSFELFNACYPVILCLIAWLWFLTYGSALFDTRSKINRHKFQSHEYSIDDNFLIMARGDGAYSRIPFSIFVKCYKILGHYILEENLVSAHIIPASAFNSSDDVEAFEKQLKIEA